MSNSATESPRPAKRARQSRTQNQGGITTTNSVPSALGVTEIMKIDKGKGNAKQIDIQSSGENSNDVPNNDGQNNTRNVDKIISERTKKSWETRRARKSVQEAVEGIIALGEEDENGAGPSNSSSRSLYTPHQPDHTIPIPTTEFLLSIHHYTSTFYMNNGLLFQPTKKGRSVPWGSKKRLLLMRDAENYNSTPTSISNSSKTRSSKSKSTSGIHEHDDDEEIDELSSEGEGEEIDELDESYTNQIKQEGLVDEYGELILGKDRNKTKDGKRKERIKGKYKKRDLYKAIEGEGLMALGILLQEHIINSIHTAGYTKSIPISVSPISTIPPSTSSPKRRKKVNTKDTNNKKRPRSDSEDEVHEVESEEGQGSD